MRWRRSAKAPLDSNPFSPGAAKQGPGFVLETSERGRTLVVTDAWTTKAERQLRKGVASGLVLNYAKGYRERSLEFLRDWPITHLSVVARTTTDLEPVYRLADTLASLDLITSPSATLDLARLPHLRRVSADWQQVRDSIAVGTQLEDLYVGSYAEIDLHPLARNTALTKLVMKDRPALRSLDGLDRLVRLEHLGIYLARHLSDIDHLAIGDHSQLRTLALGSCRGVRGLDPIGRCAGLVALDVSECGEIDTLRPLQELADLESLQAYGSTNVLDGDLAPIASRPKLAELRMRNRPHYRPSVVEIQTAIGWVP